MRAIAGRTGIRWSLFLVLLLTTTSCCCCLRQAQASGLVAAGKNATEEMVPLVEPGKPALMTTTMMLMMNDTRRKLGSFQICALCTCCGGASKSYCLASPCCYAINCNIPNRPFGFCSFTPKTCNCFGCHI